TLAAREIDLSGRIDGPPLPRIDEVDDLALAALWRDDAGAGGGLGRGIEERRVTVAGESYYFLMRPMSGAGPQNWMVGVWFPERESNREIRRLIGASSAGVAILLVSLAVAFYLARRISRSIGHFAEEGERVRSLDFSDTRPIPPSQLAEIDRAAAAFNAMLAGLRWFETYVPKALVLRLMKRGVTETNLRSEERVVSVMFTDIRGFSEMARSLSPSDTQALLTRHFSLLAGCIEAEGGTVDKFIGDAVMAFWGAPDDQPDHAARALRAAIAAAVERANREAAGIDASPVHVRVALHSGPVVVGNIGSAVRVNYTIIGDTVNVAARLEELARALHRAAADTCVLVSDDTVRFAA
ncbi:adenylate/guanylate cyclase domain-containing protein, partial [bacterium]|nr:adenylate/guanylate cyclase domain-containing protein [bacterium]